MHHRYKANIRTTLSKYWSHPTETLHHMCTVCHMYGCLTLCIALLSVIAFLFQPWSLYLRSTVSSPYWNEHVSLHPCIPSPLPPLILRPPPPSGLCLFCHSAFPSLHFSYIWNLYPPHSIHHSLPTPSYRHGLILCVCSPLPVPHSLPYCLQIAPHLVWSKSIN